MAHLGRSVALMDGLLHDAEGALCARATASARLLPWPGAEAPAA